MKKLFLCAALLIVASLSAQVAGKDFTYKPLKWTIKVPAGYDKAETDEENLEENEEVIFSIAKGEGESMEATIEPYNENPEEYVATQEMTASFMKEILGAAIEEEGGKIELTTEKETIGGKEFYNHKMVLTYDGETTIMHLFNSLIDGKDFCMSISYIDPAQGDIMLKAFRESKFK